MKGVSIPAGISRRALDKLSDRQVAAWLKRAREGTAATKKLSDGGGLYCTLTSAGTPIWRIKYRYANRERLFSIGMYPEITLAEAREERARVRKLLREGKDPVEARRDVKVAQIRSADESKRTTFEEFAREWLVRRKQKNRWSDIHARQVRQSLERHLFKRFGGVALRDVTQRMVADAIQEVIDRRRYETAAKLLQNVMLIFDSAKLFHHRSDNPAEGLADELIPSGQMPNKRPALLEFDVLGDLLRRTDLAPIAPQVRLALKLVAYTAIRIGNALTAEWSEFDLDSDVPVWTVPREKMKAKRRDYNHKVLLGPTIVSDLRTWRQMTGGNGYLFPAPAGGAHLRHETLEKVYRRTLGMEGKHSVHGWRASFSSLAKDSGLFTSDAVNLALDHVHDSAVALAYDRGERLKERIRLAYWWDSQLAAAQSGIAQR
jgi:integrase